MYTMGELLSRACCQRPLRRQPRSRDPRGLTSSLCGRGAVVAVEEPWALVLSARRWAFDPGRIAIGLENGCLVGLVYNSVSRYLCI